MPPRHATRPVVVVLLTLLALGAAADGGAERITPAAASPECAHPPALADDGSPPLLLAERYRSGIDLAHYWVSEKLDGVRAYWDGTGLISRGGHPIRTPPGFSQGFPPTPLDGELWIDHGRFAEVSGIARRLRPDPAAWAEVRYMVFDLPCHPGPFGERLAALRGLLKPPPGPHIRLIPQGRIPDHAALMARLDAVVAAGGEGLMLHRDDSRYQAGRSDDLLKVKPHQDAEARVVAHLPGKGKYQGMLGSLLVEEPDGTRFRIGTGFSDAERRHPPAIGAIVTFKYHGRTSNGLPRFASFLRVREPGP